MNSFLLSNKPLELALCESLLRSKESGGEVVFIGTVRSSKGDREVSKLEFEAYEPMVQLELEKIAEEMRLKWPLRSIVLHHRTGTVIPGEVAVIAGASSMHRKEAFAACEYLMKRLKETVPIWKKEFLENGEYWVTQHP